MALLDIAIDVSHHNGNLNWDAIARAGIRLALIKASQNVADPMWTVNAAAARGAGIYVIPYHFVSGAQPYAQAEVFSAVAELGPGTPYALDWEGDGAPDAEVVENIGLLLAKLTGRKPLGYWGIRGSTPRAKAPTSEMQTWDRWVPRYYSGGAKEFADHSAAHRAAGPGERFLLWQYTEHGRLPGMSGNFDRNVWFGTLDDLAAYMGVAVSPTPQVGEIVAASPFDTIKRVQEALGVEADGAFGRRSRAALNALLTSAGQPGI